jgi:hypothetical protein
MDGGGVFYRIDAWLTASLLIVAMFCSWRLGWWLGAMRPSAAGDPPAETLGDASFALLGLLLAFTLGLALQKHETRRVMVVAEANAIGDFYTCAQVMQEPLGHRLRHAIAEYTRVDLRILRERPNGQGLVDALAKLEAHADEMTGLVREAVKENDPLVIPLTNTLNEVSSAREARISAIDDRLTTVVVMLLAVTSVVALALSGWRHGALGKPERIGTTLLVVLLGLVVYVILDLDQPARGTIRVSTSPVERLLDSIKE